MLFNSSIDDLGKSSLINSELYVAPLRQEIIEFGLFFSILKKLITLDSS